MPLYEYLCDNCNNKFEIRRMMQEIDAPAACPECAGDRVQRQISLVFAALAQDARTGVTQGESGTSAVGGGCGCGGSCNCGYSHS